MKDFLKRLGGFLPMLLMGATFLAILFLTVALSNYESRQETTALCIGALAIAAAVGAFYAVRAIRQMRAERRRRRQIQHEKSDWVSAIQHQSDDSPNEADQ